MHQKIVPANVDGKDGKMGNAASKGALPKATTDHLASPNGEPEDSPFESEDPDLLVADGVVEKVTYTRRRLVFEGCWVGLDHIKKVFISRWPNHGPPSLREISGLRRLTVAGMGSSGLVSSLLTMEMTDGASLTKPVGVAGIQPDFAPFRSALHRTRSGNFYLSQIVQSKTHP
jgi:hypothetical protein